MAPLTAEQIEQINARAVNNLGIIYQTICGINGKPTGVTLAKSPAAAGKRIRHFHLQPANSHRGAWFDLEQVGSDGYGLRGADLIEFAQWWIGGDREHAARWLDEIMRRELPDNPPPPPLTGFRPAQGSRSGRVPHRAA